jgi:hypothetical protein
MPLLEREAPGFVVQFFVNSTICVKEIVISGFGIPEVDREVEERAGGIPPELSSPKMGIALKELDPRAMGPIGTLKAVFTS